MAEHVNFLVSAEEEFKKLPTWGKVAGFFVLVLVVGVAIYQKQHAKPSTGAAVAANSTPGTSDLSGALSGGGGGGVTQGVQGPPGPTGATGAQGKPGTSAPPAPAPKPVAHPPTPKPAPPKPAPKPAPKIQRYTVVSGNNLSQIAATHHIKGGWQAIYNNGNNRNVIGGNPNLIRPGQVLDLSGLV